MTTESHGSTCLALARLRRSMCSLLAAVLLAPVAVLLLAQSAWAQDVDPRPTARTRLGPLYLNPRFAIRDVGFDSNVFNSPDNPISDFTFGVKPEVDWAVGMRRFLLTWSTAADLQYFATQVAERSVNPEYRGQAQVSLRRVTLFAGGSYRNTRRRPNEFDGIPESDFDARARRVMRTAEAGVGLAITSKLSTSVVASRDDTAFDADATFEGTFLQEVLNRDRRTVAASISYDVTPLTKLVVSSEASETRFALSPVRDSDSVRSWAGLDFNPRAIISGSARIGYRRFSPLDEALTPFSGLVARVNVSYRILESLVLGGSMDRAVGYSFSRFEPYYVLDGYGLSLRRRLSARFDMRVDARRRWYRYRRLNTDAGHAPGGRIDIRQSAGVEMGYRLGPVVRFGIGLSYWDYQSDELVGANYHGFGIGTSLTYGY